MTKRKPLLAWGIRQVKDPDLVQAADSAALFVFITRRAAREEVRRYASAADVPERVPERVVRVEIREVGRKG